MTNTSDQFSIVALLSGQKIKLRKYRLLNGIGEISVMRLGTVRQLPGPINIIGRYDKTTIVPKPDQ